MGDTFPTLLTAWAAFATAAISPGPNMVAVVSRALGSGRASALATTAGIATGAFGWALLTTLGLGALFESVPVLLNVLGLLGGAYLGWLGLKGWRAALIGTGGKIAPVPGRGLRADFIHGCVVTGTNPKVALLWASLSTFVGGATTSVPLLLLFAGISAMLATAIYGTYALVFAVSVVRQFHARFSRVAEGVFGTAFGLLGLAMILRAAGGA
ncbi:lysine exporter protein [Rhodovulum sulfidophilum]|uniref:Lysine exporter protein n=1 Tax=Rhodovulum sulfidophilum TaxID=35806 RepID=A0A0D6B5J5_RHOSU|nr:lysine exporter protein [Rhodovulum sulfidophilum]